MTCVVGYQHEGDVILAADSAVGHFGDKMTITGRKFHLWETSGGMLGIGFSGSGRLAQSLIVGWKPPVANCEPEFYPFKVGESIAAFLQDLPYADALKGKDSDVAIDATCMIAWDGKLYILSGGLCTMHWDRPYLSIGSGSEYVMGALEMTLRREGEPLLKENVQSRMLQALEIAADVQEGVRPPFVFDVVAGATNPMKSSEVLGTS